MCSRDEHDVEPVRGVAGEHNCLLLYLKRGYFVWAAATDFCVGKNSCRPLWTSRRDSFCSGDACDERLYDQQGVFQDASVVEDR